MQRPSKGRQNKGDSGAATSPPSSHCCPRLNADVFKLTFVNCSNHWSSLLLREGSKFFFGGGVRWVNSSYSSNISCLAEPFKISLLKNVCFCAKEWSFIPKYNCSLCLFVHSTISELPSDIPQTFFFCNVNKLSLQGINNNNNKARFSFQIVTNKNVLQYVFNIVFFNMVATYRY